jgi:hypothetical protein
MFKPSLLLLLLFFPSSISCNDVAVPQFQVGGDSGHMPFFVVGYVIFTKLFL